MNKIIIVCLLVSSMFATTNNKKYSFKEVAEILSDNIMINSDNIDSLNKDIKQIKKNLNILLDEKNKISIKENPKKEFKIKIDKKLLERVK